jgi:hypothetical protein
MFPNNEIGKNKRVSSSDVKKCTKVVVNTFGGRVIGTKLYPDSSEASYSHLQGIKKLESFDLKPRECKTFDREVFIDVTFWRETNGFSAALSFLTLTLIPMKEVEKFRATATVFDSKEKVLAEYKFEDSIDTWFQLFFLFYIPFHERGMKDKVANNLIDKILTEAIKDNLI